MMRVLDRFEPWMALTFTEGNGPNSVPGSAHVDDQAERYATGELGDVYFYPEELDGPVEREYRPGR